MHTTKEAYAYGKEAYAYDKRGLCIRQKRPMYMAKEAYAYGKRGLCIRQKKPNSISVSCVPDWQKRPMYTAEEAYVYGKRGLIVFLCLVSHTGSALTGSVSEKASGSTGDLLPFLIHI